MTLLLFLYCSLLFLYFCTTYSSIGTSTKKVQTFILFLVLVEQKVEVLNWAIEQIEFVTFKRQHSRTEYSRNDKNSAINLQKIRYAWGEKMTKESTIFRILEHFYKPTLCCLWQNEKWESTKFFNWTI